jgi:hypothetical protein
MGEFVRLGRTNRDWHVSASTHYAQQLLQPLPIRSEDGSDDCAAFHFINSSLCMHRRLEVELSYNGSLTDDVYNRVQHILTNKHNQIEHLKIENHETSRDKIEREKAGQMHAFDLLKQQTYRTLKRLLIGNVHLGNRLSIFPIESMPNLKEITIHGNITNTETMAEVRTFMVRLFQSCLHIQKLDIPTLYHRDFGSIFLDTIEYPPSLQNVSCFYPYHIPAALASRVSTALFLFSSTSTLDTQRCIESLSQYTNLEELYLPCMYTWHLPTLRAILKLPRLSILRICVPQYIFMEGCLDEEGRMWPCDAVSEESRRRAQRPAAEIDRYPEWMVRCLWGANLTSSIYLNYHEANCLMIGLISSTCQRKRSPKNLPPRPLKTLVFYHSTGTEFLETMKNEYSAIEVRQVADC